MNAKLAAGADQDPEGNGHDDRARSAVVRKADDVDVYVGRRIKVRRVMMGMSQSDLAAKISVTYQQAHKYERGLNRISAGRLAVIATALNANPAWFFEGYEGPAMEAATPKHQRQLLELMRNFDLIHDLTQKQAISAMARAMAGSVEERE